MMRALWRRASQMIDALCPVHFQRCGIQEWRPTRLCVFVLSEKPGTEFQCKRLSFEGCHSAGNIHREQMASREIASLASSKRRLGSCGPRKVAYRRSKTGQPARFAPYTSSAFHRRTFRRPPSLCHVASCVLGTHAGQGAQALPRHSVCCSRLLGYNSFQKHGQTFICEEPGIRD